MPLPRPRSPWALPILVVIAGVAPLSEAWDPYEPPAKFLIVSNAEAGLVKYGRLETDGKISELRTLIEASDGLVHPQGLAVDQKRQLLLIADTGLRKVVSYGLSVRGDQLLVDEQTPVAEDVEARWVVADGMGNLYFSDEANNKIFRITAQDVTDGQTTPATLFDSTASVSVSGPGGLATDNFYVYWTNKVGGTETGSVVRSLIPASSPATQTVALLEQAQQRSLKRRLGRYAAASATAVSRAARFQVLESNTDKSYGLCLAINQMFYTDPVSKVWVANKTGGGTPVAVTTKLTSPRGCAWDGLSKLYVADRSLGGIYAFPAPMFSLAETELTKVADMEEAFGLAVFSGARRIELLAGVVIVVMLTLGDMICGMAPHGS